MEHLDFNSGLVVSSRREEGEEEGGLGEGRRWGKRTVRMNKGSHISFTEGKCTSCINAMPLVNRHLDGSINHAHAMALMNT